MINARSGEPDSCEVDRVQGTEDSGWKCTSKIENASRDGQRENDAIADLDSIRSADGAGGRLYITEGCQRACGLDGGQRGGDQILFGICRKIVGQSVGLLLAAK